MGAERQAGQTGAGGSRHEFRRLIFMRQISFDPRIDASGKKPGETPARGIGSCPQRGLLRLDDFGRTGR